MSEVLYQVKHRFKYGDRIYLPGQIFEPRGHKWDKQIIENYTRVIPVPVTQAVIPPDIETVQEGGNHARKFNQARKAGGRNPR